MRFTIITFVEESQLPTILAVKVKHSVKSQFKCVLTNF